MRENVSSDGTNHQGVYLSSKPFDTGGFLYNRELLSPEDQWQQCAVFTEESSDWPAGVRLGLVWRHQGAQGDTRQLSPGNSGECNDNNAYSGVINNT